MLTTKKIQKFFEKETKANLHQTALYTSFLLFQKPIRLFMIMCQKYSKAVICFLLLAVFLNDFFFKNFFKKLVINFTLTETNLLKKTIQKLLLLLLFIYFLLNTNLRLIRFFCWVRLKILVYLARIKRSAFKQFIWLYGYVFCLRLPYTLYDRLYLWHLTSFRSLIYLLI